MIGLTGIAALEAEMRDRLKAKDAEIERLQAAKRRALAIADERAKEANALREQLVNAVEVIKGVVTSCPVAAGTSKYGYEDDHDGYGSIRDCRLFLEKVSQIDDQHQSAPPLSGSLPSGESGLSVTTTAGGADTASQTSAQRSEQCSE